MTEVKKGCVYFFRHIGLTPIKIGFSTSESPIDRFNQFKTYAPYGSEIIGFIQTTTPKILETALHQKYATKRIMGEWFEITEDDVKYEVDFHSSIESVRDRNEFQIAWAKNIIEKSYSVKTGVEKFIELNNLEKKNVSKTRERLFEIFKTSKDINIANLAKAVGISRQRVYFYLAQYKKSLPL